MKVPEQCQKGGRKSAKRRRQSKEARKEGERRWSWASSSRDFLHLPSCRGPIAHVQLPSVDPWLPGPISRFFPPLFCALE
jgi:hypothetical protein